MPETNRFVQRRSREDIADMAMLVRGALQLGTNKVNLLSLLELAMPDLLEGYQFLVLPDEDMAGIDGLADLSEPIIRLAESVYLDLELGMPRARFTAAHELGHILMHSGRHVHYARAAYQDEQLDPEWQANIFAAEFLMPEGLFRQTQSVAEAMSRFGGGFFTARRRAIEIGHVFAVRTPKPKKKGYGYRRTPE